MTAERAITDPRAASLTGAANRRGWILFGSGGFCHDVSVSLRRWLRARPADFLVRNWTQLVHPDDYDRVRDLAAALQRNELPQTTTIRWITLHGKIVATDLQLSWSTYADDALRRIVGRVTWLREEAAS